MVGRAAGLPPQCNRADCTPLRNGRAPRLRSGCLSVPSRADCYLPRARGNVGQASGLPHLIEVRTMGRHAWSKTSRPGRRLVQRASRSQKAGSKRFRQPDDDRDGSFYCYHPIPRVSTNGGRDGCCPRCLLFDKQASLLFLFTTLGNGRRGRSCTGEACV